MQQLHFFRIVALASASLGSGGAWAQNYSIGDIKFSGNDCNAVGDVVVIMSPDNSTASLLFSDFSAEVGKTSANPKTTINLARCTARVPVKLNKKYRLQSYSVDYRGFADVEKDAEAHFATSHTTWFPLFGYVPVRAGGVHKKFRGPASEEIAVTEKVTVPTHLANATCGKTVYLDLGMRLDALTGKKKAFSRIELTSADLSATAAAAKKSSFRLGFQLLKCN